MLRVSLLVCGSRDCRVSYEEKVLDLGVVENWKIVGKWCEWRDVVLWGEVFDEVNLCLYEIGGGKLRRVDFE